MSFYREDLLVYDELGLYNGTISDAFPLEAALPQLLSAVD